MDTSSSQKPRPEETMRLLVDVFEVFKDLAQWLGEQPGVDSSDYSCRMSRAERSGEDWFTVGRGDGFEIEWCASATPDPRTILSFALSVSFDAGYWLVEFSLRGRAAHEDEEVLDERAINVENERVLQTIRNVASEIFDDRVASMLAFKTRYP